MDNFEKEMLNLKQELASQGARGLALDIDETICWTIGYLVSELQKKFGNPENLTVEEVIARYRFIKHISYWQTPLVKKWLDDYRESSLLKENLPTLEGAKEAVLAIHKIMPVVAYITARPEGVRQGTEKWLERHGFPKARVILRPSHVEHHKGNPWKAHVLHALYPRIFGIVDDNPNLVDYLPKDYQGRILVFGGGAVAQSGVINCLNWEEVIKQVSNLKPPQDF